MQVFEIVIGLLLGGALLAAAARRFSMPYPALVAIAGAALALFPRVPTLVLDPELALTLFVAPVLLDSAFDASQRDLRDNWRTVASLALGAVALTVIVVALVAHWLVPGLPWAAAIALGAIVAPPDAAAATAVLKQLRPPHRLLVILEGESLFNDASALLIYRFAVGAAIAGFASPASLVATSIAVGAGSIVLGILLAQLTLFITRRIHDIATAVIFHVRDLGDRRAAASLRHSDDGDLRDVDLATRRARDRRAPARVVIRSVGSRGVRAERARVHPRRFPAAPHHRAHDLDRLPRRRRRSLRRSDRFKNRVGIRRCRGEPLALQAARERRRYAA